ncbi:MAG: hypothetical protein ABJI96_08325 [Paracoccaceae bacterium]
MNGTRKIFGGLGFASGSTLRLERIRQTVQFSLKKQGCVAQICADLTHRSIRFSADECTLTLKISEPLPHPGDVSERMIGRTYRYPGLTPEDIALRLEIGLADCSAKDPERFLATLMIDLARAHDPISVEWLSPAALVRTEDFLYDFNVGQIRQFDGPQRIIRHKGTRRLANFRALARSIPPKSSPAPTQDASVQKSLAWPDAQVALAEAYELPSVAGGTFRSIFSLARIANNTSSRLSAALSLPIMRIRPVIARFRRQPFHQNGKI